MRIIPRKKLTHVTTDFYPDLREFIEYWEYQWDKEKCLVCKKKMKYLVSFGKDKTSNSITIGNRWMICVCSIKCLNLFSFQHVEELI
jgi:hypothetical protein